MLIEFKFKNFRSFKNETTFSMTAVKSFKEHIDSNFIDVNRPFKLLKSALVMGSNGGGKSNFTLAMNYMSNVIANSYKNSLVKVEERIDENCQFKLSSETENGNTMLEVSFIIWNKTDSQNEIFRYGYEINNYQIKKEWLYRKVERESQLFFRDPENEIFDINSESFSEGEKYKDEVNANVLFISHLAQNNQLISRKIFEWFSSINVISGLHESFYSKYTAKLLKQDTRFKKWATNILRFLEITNLEADENDGHVVTYHNKYDENNILIGSVPFKHDMESEGTNKLIHLLGPIYNTMKFGKILYIDEFDSKLHPNLTKKLLLLFNKFNKNGAQIILTAHDTNLLDQKTLRRDQIWFVEKDQFGVSDLYSLSEFNGRSVRNTSAIDIKYLDNKFGGAYLDEIDSNLLDLLYGEEN
ncbi:AAA family ATPase [Chryseobacterium scophthalmum]|uniref:AAA family ATPase n=1 Tax=Chryseobacterium scophthalmum TaxID=59733 RepID=UPI00398A6BE6